MAHERIGDGADDSHRAVAEAAVELLLQEHDVGLAARARLVVHAMIGDHADDGAGGHHGSDPLVDGTVENVGLRLARSVRVLHEIGEREIEERRRLALQQAQAGVQHVKR